MPDTKTISVRTGTHRKLKKIKAHRRWPISEAIDVLADRELQAIEQEKRDASAASNDSEKGQAVPA